MIAAGVAVTGAYAQADFGVFCFDPDPNFNPFSNPFGINGQFNDLFEFTIGGVGTVGWDGQAGRCFNPDITLDVPGRIGFAVGPVGSTQSDFDQGMALTMGFPYQGGNWSTAVITRGGQQVSYYGKAGMQLFFDGASDRYVLADASPSDDITVKCRLDLVGDATRVSYRLINNQTTAANLGLWFGQWVELLTRNYQSAGAFGKTPYIMMPGRKPFLIEQEVSRTVDAANYPSFVNFNFSQTNAYGLQVILGPSETTYDETGQSDATQSDEFKFGEGTFNLGGIGANPPFADSDPIDITVGRPSYIVKYPEQSVPAGGSRTIVQYFKSTWSFANYAKPYAVVVDAPRLLAQSAAGVNGLTPNPFTIRVYVDNIRGYTTVNEEVTLNEVKVNLNLPQATGLKLATGQSATRIIDRIAPRQIRFVDFVVVANGKTYGSQGFTVKVTPNPGPVKTVKGSIMIAATPKLFLKPKANLVSIPFKVNNTSLSSVLGLKSPTEFQAFAYSPQQRGYILQTNVQRGKGYWVVYNKTTNAEIDLQGSPTTPTDTSTGAPNIVLKSGWNLIGNPYNYVFPLGQLVGVSGSAPGEALTWAELVQQGIVGPALAYWDNSLLPARAAVYKYLEGTESPLAPNTGYWLYVNTSEDLTLAFPPVYQEFLPGSSRSPEKFTAKGPTVLASAPKPTYSVQMIATAGSVSAGQSSSVDDQNFFGQASHAAKLTLLQRPKPPKAPVQSLNAYFKEESRGQNLAMSRYYKLNGNTTFDFVVESESNGLVVLTWPNLATALKTVKFTIRDLATGVTRDMRATDRFGYTASKGKPSTFRITATWP